MEFVSNFLTMPSAMGLPLLTTSIQERTACNVWSQVVMSQ